MNPEKVCNCACGKFWKIFLILAAVFNLDQLFLKLYKNLILIYWLIQWNHMNCFWIFHQIVFNTNNTQFKCMQHFDSLTGNLSATTHSFSRIFYVLLVTFCSINQSRHRISNKWRENARQTLQIISSNKARRDVNLTYKNLARDIKIKHRSYERSTTNLAI